MKKKKIIFGLAVFILLSSLGYAADWYMRGLVSEREVSDHEVLNQYPNSMIATMASYSAKNDPTRVVLPGLSSPDVSDAMRESIEMGTEYRKNDFLSDPAVSFWLVDKTTHKVVDGNSQESYDSQADKNIIWSKTISDTQAFKNEFNLGNYPYSGLVGEPIGSLSDQSYVLSDRFDYVFTIEKADPKMGYSSSNETLGRTLDSLYIINASGAVAFGSLIVGVFMLLAPISVETETPPYSGLWRTHFEWVLIILTLLGTGAIAGIISLSPYFYTQKLGSALGTMNTHVGPEFVQKMGPIVWALSFLIISMIWFYLKRMVTYGFVRTYKEKSYVGQGFGMLKRRVVDFALSPLNTHVKKRIIGVLVGNFLVMTVLILMGRLGVFLSFMYLVALIMYALQYASVVSKDYETLHQHASDIAKGRFNTPVNYVTGMFKPISSELETINEGFDQAVKEAVQSQSTKSELITNVSHDLKTPLTGIRNYTELLQDNTLTPQQKQDYLNRLTVYTVRMTKLIEDLFEISKATSGDMSLEKQKLDIVSLIHQVVVENQDSIDAKGIDVVANYEQNPLWVSLDANKTYRIFDNLIQNVAKYAMDDSRFYIDVVVKDRMAWIEMKNMSKNPLNFDALEIQERFVRGDKSRTEEGSGLGLAIAEKFTTIQDGTFTIQIDGDLFKVCIQFDILEDEAPLQ